MSDPESVGHQLRRWRRQRNLSQLDLAIRADISTRHVSFVETGRTIPSSGMVLRLAEHLNVPPQGRNRLLVAAGHAPIFRSRPPDDPDFERVRAALRRILRAHEPYPAAALDHRWNVLLANTGFDILLEQADPDLLRAPINLMRLGFHPKGLAPRIRNLAQVRAHLLPRLHRQAAQTGDRRLHELYEELRSYGPHEEPQPPDLSDIALPIRLDHCGVELCFVNTITTFGAAFDVTLDDIAIETYLPADDATAQHCHQLARAHASAGTHSGTPTRTAIGGLPDHM
ncbi:helix-turn-helix transcriptional regulator [Plantactinospora sp. KLBMP9567]|uniref:helix-turn-helix domain-containing protein n=1 Tax=Plantactinospora sp. KLBMP9567 TaxID=3085900 RepID=UPI00298212E4|nr:helix-turn-helix transcriptional regulator [Plantactinospora sp. KLBMP9567]MDW5327169.1 helix-turn-helix transcriptional regulator [Plantactinospora sp. KLBMP9567]